MRIELEAGMLPGYAWSMVESSPAATTAPTNTAEAPVVRVRTTTPHHAQPPTRHNLSSPNGS